MSRFLVLTGLLLIVTGMLVHLKIDVPYLGWMGKLPGDIIIRKKHLTIYFPLATSLLISAVLSLIYSALFKSKN